MSDNKEKFANMIGELIKEINLSIADESIYEDSEFYNGYRSGARFIMKMIEDFLEDFDISDSDLPEKMINVDEWFRQGKNYRMGLR